jgi:hypothetical protein
VLGSEEVDVERIDYEGLRFGPGAAEPLYVRWLSRWRRDLNRDGHPDLLLSFLLEESGLAVGDTEACVEGHFDGSPFRACDGVRVREPKPRPWWARWFSQRAG